MERQKVSGCPQTAATPENDRVVEEMIYSQEDDQGSHVPPKDFAEGLKISQSSVQAMIKRQGVHSITSGLRLDMTHLRFWWNFCKCKIYMR